MTLRFRLDGVDMGDTVVRLADGIAGLSSAADGNPAFAGIVIEDPLGVWDLEGFHRFSVDEDACSVPRIFTGYLAGKRISRGKYRNGPGRIWDCDVVDLNGIMHLQILHASTAKRPAESDIVRIDWLLSDPLNGKVYDNGGVDRTNANPFEESDYRDQYADDVMRSVGLQFKIFYVDWDETAPAGQEVSLYYQRPNAIVRTSTLRISNVPADSSYGTSLTTFPPHIDATLNRDPSDQYGSVRFHYRTGVIYTERASTITQMGLTRGMTYQTDRVGSLAVANLQSTALLDEHAAEEDTVTVTVRLPRAQVNLVRQGDRIECKFSHLPGLTAFDFRRVEQRTVNLAANNEDYYNVTLVLSNKAFSTGVGGLGPGGGGDPDDFPHQPGSHWYSGYFTTTEDAGGFAGTVGGTGTGGDHTIFSSNTTGAVFEDNTTYTYEITVEVPHAGVYSPVAALQNLPSIPPLTEVAAANWNGPSPVGALTYTQSGSFTTANIAVNNAKHLMFSSAGTHFSTRVVTVTYWFDPAGWVGAEAPSPAQWVLNETPAPAPGGGRKDFSTAWPFADGSLKVRVDDIDQTAAITSSNGNPGTPGAIFNNAARGPAAYTVPATTATVAAPYGSAQVIAAIAAAGAGGSVLFPHAGSPYNFAVATAPASQTWWLAEPTTFINNTVTVQDTSITIQGGKIANIHLTRPTQQAAGFHLADCYVLSASGYGIQIEGSHNNVLIERCRFAGQSLDPIHITYDVGGDGNMNNLIVQDCIMSTNNDHSMISGNDGGGTNDLTSYKILNNDINAGSRQGGNGFGIELWGGVNGEVAYNDLRGGGFLMSTVRSQGIHTHHNRFSVGADGAYAFYEAGGADHTGALIEYNVGSGDGTGAFIYHDTGSNSCTFQWNNVTNVQYFVQGSGAGGGYTVQDNYYTGVGSFIEPNASWGTPNIVNRNGPGYGPVAGGTFQLNFDPRSDEVLTVDYQGR